MHKISLEQFEGPLDLLLQLIEKQKLQITEISLAKITDQYLDYIDNSEDIASEEVADFLLIASKLIYLKSKHLLPNLELEADEDVQNLEKQLKIYRQYYDASKYIQKMWNTDKRTFVRITPYKLPKEEGFAPPTNIETNIMAEVFQIVLNRIQRIVNLPKVIMAKAISIGEKILHIKDLIKNSSKLTFTQLINGKKDKTEAVVSFLAMLELVKQREIEVSQDSLFAEVNISHNGDGIKF
ncbi:segregation/condensation protein A [bacterium]|jgi:segregation and condensation protein A|nr:segregation/condensation protein A [bacterium]MBT4649121.1 segregation/condensation protein A [bacterium]